jgi:DNA-binding NtrC family response regulator
VEDLAFQVDLRAAPARLWNEALDDFRRDLLRTSLARNDGNRSATARELGISRQALLYHLRILGVAGPAQGEKKGADLSVRRRKEEV